MVFLPAQLVQVVLARGCITVSVKCSSVRVGMANTYSDREDSPSERATKLVVNVKKIALGAWLLVHAGFFKCYPYKT